MTKDSQVAIGAVPEAPTVPMRPETTGDVKRAIVLATFDFS